MFPEPSGDMKAVVRTIFLACLLINQGCKTEANDEVSDRIPSTTASSRANDLKWKTGIWGPWSSWSSCSRSCGRGVSTQARECAQGSGYLRHRRLRHNRFHSNHPGSNDKRCLGRYRRYQLCESQPCPHPVDMRREQCAAFNKKPFMGQFYNWDPYLGETDHCELQCRPFGKAFYTTLAKIVEDGTPCNTTRDEDRICVAGQCKVIGCDRILDSNRKMDHCGVCGGNDLSCQRITGFFSNAPLPVGYNTITKIPVGAFNINVTETNRGRNYLALRLAESDFIINGNWSISRSGSYQAAGTVFSYHRQSGIGYGSGSEYIFGEGPTTEPVELMLVYHNRNPLVYYSYSLPKPNKSRVDSYPNRRDTSRHIQNESNDVSKYIPKRSRISPRERSPNRLVPSTSATTQLHSTKEQPPFKSYDQLAWPNNGNEVALPPPSQSSVEVQNDVEAQKTSAKFLWNVAGFKPCTQTCGGGVSQAEVKCFSNDQRTIVDDRFCEGLAKLKGPSLPCNKNPCEPSWTSGPWSLCSVTCGLGKQTRKVSCSRRVSPSATLDVQNDLCTGDKPSETAECNVKCSKWHTSEWSSCTADCGKGERHRKVYCKGELNEIVDDEDCLGEKPKREENCFLKPCDESQWMTTEWQECSDPCGSGNQSRKVACLNGNQKVAHELCDRNQRPKDIRSCGLEENGASNAKSKVIEKCQKGKWFSGDWTKCSSLCGPGSQTRNVVCLRLTRSSQWEVSEESYCEESEKPTVKQKCTSKPCENDDWYVGEWSTCSKSCGTGDQSRGLVCLSLESEKCPLDQKPSTLRSCNTHPCPADSLQKDYSSGSIQITSDPGCTNKWSNCYLAVQANLCRTQHYRDLCCLACTKQKKRRTVRRLRLNQS